MLYKIKNTSHRGKAFKVKGGMDVVKAGETKAVDCQSELTDEKIDAFKGSGVLITQVKAKAKTKKRTGLEKQAAALGIEFTDDVSDNDLIAAIKITKAA